MSAVESLLAKLRVHGDREAMVWRGHCSSYRVICEEIERIGRELAHAGIEPGDAVTLESDFSPHATATLLALFELGAIAVPLTPDVEAKKALFRSIAGASWSVELGTPVPTIGRLPHRNAHPLLAPLRDARRAGLILFTSGSTGAHKAVLHDVERLLPKYLLPRHCLRTLAFLQFDHIGGLDTLIYNLANGSCLVTLASRRPDEVCAAIATHRVEVLPVSPSFINLLLLSGAHRRHDLSSLRAITYGAEVMPESTLARLHAEFPGVKLLQKFGATEIGTLRSRSRGPDSAWLQLGGENCDFRVVDGLLEIKAPSAMLGYLNAPSPFTADGWFKTGDAVEQDGEWLRILGRKAETINVGGEKVYPAEVEDVLLAMDGVAEATVVGEPNALLGTIVSARVKLRSDETAGAFRRRMLEFCRGRLPAHKIPQKVALVSDDVFGGRFKKMRLNSATLPPR